MSFRIVCFTTQEIAAELSNGPRNYEMAIRMADQFAKNDGNEWGVVELVTRYTTTPTKKETES